MLVLSGTQPVAKGGKREVFSHPHHDGRCVKVWIEGKEPEALYRRQPLHRRLRKRVSSFDENNNDRRVLERIGRLNPDTVWNHIPGYYGVVDTDRGPGVVVEKICDHNGGLSRSFKACLQEYGYPDAFASAVKDFGEYWCAHRVPSRNIMVDNLVLQEPQPNRFKLYLIDGFGTRQFIPLDKIWYGTRARRRKKLRALDETIERFLAACKVS